MSSPEGTGRDPNLPRKEREAEKAWEEVIGEIETQCAEDGIPPNLKEWSSAVLRVGDRYRINVKPMILGPSGEPTLIESNLYRGTDHIETAIVVAGRRKNGAPYVLTAATSPIGPFTPLSLTALEFGRHALGVVQHNKQIGIPSGLGYAGKPN